MCWGVRAGRTRMRASEREVGRVRAKDVEVDSATLLSVRGVRTLVEPRRSARPCGETSGAPDACVRTMAAFGDRCVNEDSSSVRALARRLRRLCRLRARLRSGP